MLHVRRGGGDADVRNPVALGGDRRRELGGLAVHATQGDGELCGVAVEIPSTTTIQVDLIKKWPIAWPRLENERFIMTIGSGRPMEDAARIAYRELVRWMVEDYGWDKYEAYFFLTQAGRVRLGNMVDPKYTLGAAGLKTYLA